MGSSLVSFDETGPIQPELWRALAAMAPVILHRPLNNKDILYGPACILPMPFCWPKIGMI